MIRFVIFVALMVSTIPNPANAQNIVIQSSGGSISSGSLGEMVFSLNAVPLMRTGDIVAMLDNSDIHNELELADYQKQELKDIKAKYDNLINEIRQRPMEGETDVDKQARQKEIERAIKGRKRMMEEVLLPHQRERMHQVSMQMKMNHRGDIQMLAGEDLADLLGITEEQKQRLKKRAKEIKAEMEAEIAKIKNKARKKLLGELTANQRRQLETLLGDDYDEKPTKK